MVFPNHGEGSARLPLVKVRIVFCDVFSPLDPHFTRDSYSLVYIQGYLTGGVSFFFCQVCGGACFSSGFYSRTALAYI